MAHRHEDGTEHEHGGRQEYHIGSQHIIVDPDNQPHTHGTIKMRGAAQENDQAIPEDETPGERAKRLGHSTADFRT